MSASYTVEEILAARRLIGARIAKLRHDADISREELSHRSGVALKIITEAESGEGDVLVGDIMLLAEAFGVDVSEMFVE